MQISGWGPLDFPFDLAQLRVELRPVFNWMLKQLQGQREAIASLANTLQPWEDIVSCKEDGEDRREVSHALPVREEAEDGEAALPVDKLALDALALNWMARTQRAMDGFVRRQDDLKDHHDVLVRRVDQIFDDVLALRQGNKQIYLFSNGAAPFGVKWGRSELPKALSDLEQELTKTTGALPPGSGPEGPPAKAGDGSALGNQKPRDALPSLNSGAASPNTAKKLDGFANTRQEVEAMICHAMLQEREETLRHYRRAVSMLHDSLEALRTRIDELSEQSKTNQRRQDELESSVGEQLGRLATLDQPVQLAAVEHFASAKPRRSQLDMPGTEGGGLASSSGASSASDLAAAKANTSSEASDHDGPADHQATVLATPGWQAPLRAVDARLETAIAAMEERLDDMHVWVRAAVLDSTPLPAVPAAASRAASPTRVATAPTTPAPAAGGGRASTPGRPGSGPAAFRTTTQRRPPWPRPHSDMGPAPQVPSAPKRKAKHSSASPPRELPKAPPGAGIDAVASAMGRDPEKMQARIAKTSVPLPSHGIGRPCTASDCRPPDADLGRAVTRGSSLDRGRRNSEGVVPRPPTR